MLRSNEGGRTKSNDVNSEGATLLKIPRAAELCLYILLH